MLWDMHMHAAGFINLVVASRHLMTASDQQQKQGPTSPCAEREAGANVDAF